MKITTTYGQQLTPHQIKAYKTLHKVVKEANSLARGTKRGYAPFFDAWGLFFKVEKSNELKSHNHS